MGEVCSINGQFYTYQSRGTCRKAGGTAVPPKSDQNLDPTLPILPPPSRAEMVFCWQKAIDECVQIESKMGKDHDLATRFLQGETKGLSKDQKALYDRNLAAARVLEDTARDLFRSAFIDGAKDTTAWELFAKMVDRARTPDGLVVCLLRLSDPKVLPADRELVFRFVTSQGAAQDRLLRRISKKLVNYWKKENSRYNGWQGDKYLSPYNAFCSALEAYMGVEGFQKLLARSLFWKQKEVLNVISPETAYRLFTMPEKDLKTVILNVAKEADNFPVGTPQKIRAKLLERDLTFVNLARGMVKNAAPVKWGAKQMVPGMLEEDLKELEILRGAAGAAGEISNPYLQDRFAVFFECLSSRFWGAGAVSEERMALATVLIELYRLGPDFGFSPGTLDILLEFQRMKLGIQPPARGKLSSLQEVKKKTVVIGPAGLPAEVSAILKQTGYYELVAKNVKEILLTPEINEGMMLSLSDSGGDALPPLGIVRVDAVDREGKLLSAWQIAHVLVHEAAHVSWFRKAGAQLRRPTPDERQAYLTGALFLERYLKQGLESGAIDLNSEKATEIAHNIVGNFAAVRAANRALGYAEDNLDPDHYKLPSREFLRSHGLESAEELDMSGYPTNLAMMFVNERLDELLGGLGLKEDVLKEAKALVRRVLDGKAAVTQNFPRKDIKLMQTVLGAIYKVDGTKTLLLSGRFEIGSLALHQELTRFMILKDTLKYLEALNK